ncbi:hypothetical protein GCM10022276_17880 [Sphingomonas limnosediminicola]|uniref:Uncharacterized protein n=1 Tax=Sphingomonas limnosediminicola TaxID=940133 RepID=A0ABP7LCX1_9SPHN
MVAHAEETGERRDGPAGDYIIRSRDSLDLRCQHSRVKAEPFDARLEEFYPQLAGFDQFDWPLDNASEDNSRKARP